MIEIKSLTKSFGTQKVLNHLHLSLPLGYTHGIIGENGSGKTTLFHCIAGLLAFEGTINTPASLRIAYLPCDPYFYPKMKAIEFIEFCLVAKNIPINQAEITQYNDLFELPLHLFASEFSTGMKKKLALMALFLQHNDLYLLDEPFNGLDLSAGLVLQALIKRLQKKGCTVIVSSHLIPTLTAICNQIHFINNGLIQKSFHTEDSHEIEAYITKSNMMDKFRQIDELK